MFFRAEDCIRDADVTGVQACALPISHRAAGAGGPRRGAGLVAGRGGNGADGDARSEERRVGKECRSRWCVCRLLKRLLRLVAVLLCLSPQGLASIRIWITSSSYETRF